MNAKVDFGVIRACLTGCNVEGPVGLLHTEKEMESLIRDLRYASRAILKSPGMTAAAVITLALGIGANTAIFSVVNAVLLRPLPFARSDELVVVQDTNNKTREIVPSVSLADFFDFKSQTQSFTGLAAYSPWPITLLEDDRPQALSAVMVSDEFFATLGVTPLIGRSFVSEEYKKGRTDEIILSHQFWQRRFGGDPNIIGRKLSVEPGILNSGSMIVIGVMPPQFKLPTSAEAWIPLAQDSGWRTLRASRTFETIARLKPGVTLSQAEAEMRTIAARLEAQYPESDSNWSVRLMSLRETLVGDVRAALWILFGAVVFVLIIACANVANLLLARATTRHREMAIRAALGASRARIIRQLVVESLLLSAIGGVLGTLIAQWCAGAIVWLVPKDLSFPRIDEARVDLAVLGFTVVVAMLSGLMCGLIPGLKAARTDLQESLKESGRSATAGRRLLRLRGLMVAAEVALTMVLLAGAGLLIKSFLNLQRVDLGFNSEKLLIVPVSPSMAKYGQPQARSSYYENIAAQARTVPGVQAVATAHCPPLMYAMSFPFSIEGRAKTNEVPQAWYDSVSPNYFGVMRIPVVEGREFTDQDRDATTRVAIINETMRRRYFGGENPIGRRLTLNYINTPLTLEIVGVVRDVKQKSLETPPNAEIYTSYLQVPWFFTSLLVRTDADPRALLSSIEHAIRSIDPKLSVENAKPMDQLLSDSVAQPRFYSLLLGVFAALALVLAAVGLYGVISYAVAQRTQEIGIRMALGAQSRDVLKLVMGQGIIWVLGGVGIGIVGAFSMTRVLTRLLFNVSATDPTTFSLISLLLVGTALVACFIPARRATKVDPLEALRYE